MAPGTTSDIDTATNTTQTIPTVGSVLVSQVHKETAAVVENDVAIQVETTIDVLELETRNSKSISGKRQQRNQQQQNAKTPHKHAEVPDGEGCVAINVNYNVSHPANSEFERRFQRDNIIAEYRKRRFANARAYIKQSMIAHFCILLIAMGFEVLFLHLCYKASPISPHAIVRLQADAVSAAQKQLQEVLAQVPLNNTAIARANSELHTQVAVFKATVMTVVERGRRIFHYEVVYAIVPLFLMILMAFAVYQHRHHPVVRSRGYLYLVLIFSISSILIISSLLMAATTLWQLNQFPLELDYRDPKVLNHQVKIAGILVFVSSAITIGLISIYFATLALRQRIITHAYSTKILPLTNKQLIFWAGKWAVFAYVVTIPTLIFWLAIDGFHPRGVRYGVSGLAGLAAVWALLLFYYFYRARHASLKFNDMYSNVRATTMLVLAFAVCLTYTIYNPNHVFSASVGWSSMV